MLRADAILLGSGRVPGEDHGFIDVGLLSSATFNAAAIDLASVRLAGAPLATRGQSALTRDIDHDGRLDRVLRFAADALDLPAGTASATLVARTETGELLVATVVIGVAHKPGAIARRAEKSTSPTLRSVGPAVLEFAAPGSAPPRLVVIDVSGRTVALRDLRASFVPQRLDFSGEHLPLGIYFATLRQGSTVLRTKLIVVR